MNIICIHGYIIIYDNFFNNEYLYFKFINLFRKNIYHKLYIYIYIYINIYIS